MSLAQLLILFDHIILGILFLIALFCIVSAVMTNISSGIVTRSRRHHHHHDEEEEDVSVIERTDTCYSVKNGTSVLFESDLNNVV